MRKWIRRTLFASASCTLLYTTGFAAPMHPLVIYGSDDRLEIFEAHDPAHRILAESVVAIMPSEAIKSSSLPGMVTISGPNYGTDYKLCPIERFREQMVPAYCSGFLVAPDIIATAGHCVTDEGFCEDAKFVFGFMKDSADRDPSSVQKANVYGCRKVLKHKFSDDDEIDFALVQLDRVVADRLPLTFAKSAPKKSDAVVVIGHPLGLPAKVTGGASVRRHERGYFIANLDSYEGNSGSAVFNDNYEVAGILVRGETDFVPMGACYVTKHCQDTGCDGEDVTNADIVAKALESVLKAPKLASAPSAL